MTHTPRKKLKIQILLIYFLISLGFVTPSRGQDPAPAETTDSEHYNIILIDITCVRADHISAYGYFRKTTPFLDRLASEGICFTQAITQAYWTLPSVASLLTSKYPATHNVLSRNQKLNDSYITIAEILNQHGYKTAAFVGGLDLDAIHNLNQGFEIYSDETGENATGSFSKNFPKAISWLKENKETKSFLYIQGYDAHPPFHYPPSYEHIFDPDYRGVLREVYLDYKFLKEITNRRATIGNKEVQLDKKDIAHIIAHYDGGIRYVDHLLEEFIKELSNMKLMGKTILVICGDHGEELSDHGTFDRFGAQNLYEEVVHVPLIIKYPHLKGVKINQPVELIDVAPTILGFLKLPPENKMQGENLLPLIRDAIKENPEKYVFSGWENKQMIRSARWKLVYKGDGFELYDLNEDPKELNNLARQRPEVVADLSKRLFDWFVATRFKGDAKRMLIPTEELPEFWRKIYKNKKNQTLEENDEQMQ